jgi:hypothetical protein
MKDAFASDKFSLKEKNSFFNNQAISQLTENFDQ